MLNFSKSSSDDKHLQNRTSVQHRVLCDWLRNIQTQNIQITKKLSLVLRQLDTLLEGEPRPEDETDDSSEGRSVS